MNADAFRHLYNYHFSENRSLWDTHVMSLSQEQFTQPVPYSIGSVRNQLVHLMSVDDGWFSELQGLSEPVSGDAPETDDRDILRAHWDTIEQNMRNYLANLRDAMLFEKPVAEGQDKDLILWQVLLHIVNHGTDHRAQVLRILHDLGAKTVSQDYIFYVYDHP